MQNEATTINLTLKDSKGKSVIDMFSDTVVFDRENSVISTPLINQNKT